MPDYRFVRLWRTSQSEAYEILDAQEPLARLDLHYTSSVVYGLMILEKELPEEGVQDLIEVVDSEIVDSVDTPREDFPSPSTSERSWAPTAMRCLATSARSTRPATVTTGPATARAIADRVRRPKI